MITARRTVALKTLRRNITEGRDGGEVFAQATALLDKGILTEEDVTDLVALIDAGGGTKAASTDSIESLAEALTEAMAE